MNAWNWTAEYEKFLPDLEKYKGKTLVVKYGGSVLSSHAGVNQILTDLLFLSSVGIQLVLVHGGGPEINEALARIGKEPKFVDGLRYTDSETMEIVQEVLCGKVGKNLAASLNRIGGRAISISGLDGNLIGASRKFGKNGQDLGFVGEIEEIDSQLLRDLLALNYTPVVSTVAFGLDGAESYNINGDTAAAELAAAMDAECLLLMTDVPGILKDSDNPDSLITSLSSGELPALVADGVVSDGMIPKISCCADAVEKGVGTAQIFDGRAEHCILQALANPETFGTQIIAG